jgi:hypothetical protein
MARQITRRAEHHGGYCRAREMPARLRRGQSGGKPFAILSHALTFVGFVVPNDTSGRGTYSAMTCYVTRDAGLPAVAIPCGAPFCAAQRQSLAAAYIRRDELFPTEALYFSACGVSRFGDTRNVQTTLT